MKKLIVLLSAIAFACSVNAQNTLQPAAATPAGAPMQHKMKDWVIMRDGKMMTTKDGKLVAMDKEMTLTNGDKVMTDGTIMKKDGTKMTMKNGDRMDMDGKMVQPRKMPMPGQAQPMQQAQPLQQQK